MSKRIRFTALLLAVSLFLNTASLPVTAEGALDSTLFTQEESAPTTAETQYTTAPQEAVTEAATETTAAAASEVTTEAPTEATTETTTEAATEATEGTTEATTEATQATAEATTGETEEATEATDATEETTEATTEAPQEPIRGKVVCTTSVNIRSGPGTGYEILGSAYNEDVVYVYEIAHMEDADWGRIGEGRWICLTYVILEGTAPTEGTEATEATDATEATQATEETTEATTEATEPTEESKETEATETTEATDATETTESTEATDATELPELEAEPALLNLDGPVPNLTVDEAKNLPIDQGHMDLYWWAAVCNKTITWKDKTATVSALAEEPVDAAPAEEETDPTEESTVPATEETTVPASEESTVPVTEETTVPVTEATIPVTEETTVPVTEAATTPVTEAATVPETTAASADIQSLSDAEVVAFSETENITTTTDTRNLIPEDGKIPIENAGDLICLSYVDPKYYQDLTIEVGPNGSVNELNIVSDQTITVNGEDLHFRGLGNSSSPFKGSFLLHNTSNAAKITLDKALFEYLSGSAVIGRYNSGSDYGYVTLNCAMPETSSLEPARSDVLLADHVTEAAGNAAEWYVALYTSQETSSDIPPLLPLLNSIDSGYSAKVRIKSVTVDQSNITDESDKKPPVVSGSGFLCNTMGASSVLTITGIANIPEVKNEKANSHTGGLVGTMDDGAELNFTGVSSLTLNSVTAATKGNAGGLVGYASNPTFTAMPTITAVDGATIKGNDAGGLVGWMEVSNQSEPFSLQNPLTDLTVEGEYSSGGLFGILCNKGGSYTISWIISEVSFSRDSTSNTNAGGLIGAYTASSLENTLILTENNTTSTLTKAVNNYGGLIGRIWNDYDPQKGQPVYIQINGATVTTTESAIPKNYGGLIGSLDDVGNMVHVTGAVSITSNYNNKNQFIGSDASGGLVGRMKQGVLRLSSVPNWAKATPTGGSTAKRGWILGERDNTLVYYDGTDEWNAQRSSLDAYKDTNTNDTGVWGQVLRADLLGNDLLTFNEADHTVTVRAINPSTGTGEVGTEEAASGQADSVSISDVTAFAALALRLQLDEKGSGALRFDGGDYTSRDNVSISLEGNIDLTATTNDGTGAKSCVGLTGLTRDVNSTPLFSFTIDGKGHTVTLPDLMIYASSGGHDRQGLFGKADKFTVSNLAVAGNVTAKAINGDWIYAGGLLAEANGAVDLTTVTSSVDMTITGGSGDNCAYAGIVASLSPECTSVSLNGCILSDKSIIIDSTSKKSYVGGFVGFANRNGNQSGIHTKLSVTNCSLSGTLEKRKLTSEYVRIGGLIATMYHGTYSLTVSGLKVSGLTVSAPDMSSGSCGGLLGYEWMNTTADISGVSIDGCSLNANSALFGGLVYKSSGYWKVHQGTVAVDNPIPGIHFTGNQSTFNGASSNTTPSGLLVSRGDNILNSDGSQKGALYMEIGDGAYQIDTIENTCMVQVTLPGSEYFDEIVGITKGSYGNGIVSYATAGHALIDQGSCNTYSPQLSTHYDNPKTRYYYNLDSFRSSFLGENGEITSDTGNINSAAEMVLWSARKHCDGSIAKYFPSTPSGSKLTGDLDLKGYSYYPVSFDGSVFIENATITFDYANLQAQETANKQPSNAQRQHYEMHTGIFTNMVPGSATSGLTLTIRDLTLAGTVGGSAIIRDNVNGLGTSAMAALDFNQIKLNGIRVACDTLCPLLVNQIGSYTSLNLVDVTTLAGYDNLTDHAATSLFGDVGSETGTNIQLDFSQIALDGREEADEEATKQYNTTRSIFKDALFLKSFRYSDAPTCWGTYNFDQTDESKGGPYYTLGKELSNAEDGSYVRNGGQQFWFYQTKVYVYKQSTEGTSAEAAAAYSSGYLRYVGNQEGLSGSTADSTYHEMDINLTSPNLLDGCGTYSDPFIITAGNPLQAVANVLDGQNPKKGWKITMNKTVLDGGFSSQDGHTKDASSDDAEFTYNGSNWVAGETTYTNEKVLDYLRNAYYQLVGDDNHTISFSSGWGGLGGSDPSLAFRGVIVGKGDVTVHISVPTAQKFGGLVKYSQGSVVRNVKIVYDEAITITNNDTVPRGVDAPFFGGVVGWCVGGDTIIENVTMTYQNSASESTSPKVTGGNNYLVAVGGYVGLVGGTQGTGTASDGLGGGVVFRGRINGSLNGDKASGSSGYFYYNPYVGRVLDGYALSVSPTLDNTDKNYTIPTISANPGLSFKSDTNTVTVTVSDANGLWLLSAIANSGAGAVNTLAAYQNGKARTCLYDKVGTGTAVPADWSDESSGTLPYLISHYSLGNGFSTLTSSGDAISIVLTANCDMKIFGNGFRGIGGSYGAIGSTNRLIKVASVSGGGSHTITLGQDRKEYTAESENWTTLGTGLFPVLNPAGSPTVTSLNLAGTTGITYYNGTSNTSVANPIGDSDNLMDAKRTGYVGAGMLAGCLAKSTSKGASITLQNIELTGSVNGNAAFAGGLIGLACINREPGSGCLANLSVENCFYSDLSVSGYAIAGGLLGYAYASKLSIKPAENSTTTFSGTNSVVSQNTSYSAARMGVGGLIGRCDTNELVIGSENENDTPKFEFKGTLKITCSSTSTSGDIYSSGGIGGMLGVRQNGSANIRNIDLGGNVTISNGTIYASSGGLVGVMGYYNNSANLFNNDKFGWTNGSVTVNVSNIHIADGDTASLTVKKTSQGGALFGALMAKTATVKKLFIGSDSSKVTVSSNDSKSTQSLGGVIGSQINTMLTLEEITVINTNVWRQYNNSDPRGTGLLIGYAEKTGSIKIRNAKLKGCKVAVNSAANNAYTGLLYGYVKENPVNGFNILIQDCTIGLSLENGSLNAFTDSTNPDMSSSTVNQTIGLSYKNAQNQTKYTPYPDIGTDYSNYTVAKAIGIFGGYTNKATHLVGVSVKNCNTPMKDFGKDTTGTSYAIRADYGGAAAGIASNVTTLPQKDIPGKPLTGDGIAFTKDENGVDTSTPLAQGILQDYLDTATIPRNRIYFNVTSEMDKFCTTPEGGTKTAVTSFFSTYNNAGENEAKQAEDFPVLVISSNKTDEISEQIKSFIAMMTNEAFNTGSPSITVKTYQWSGTTFAEQSNATLTYNEAKGTFSVNSGRYDNQLNQFTLLDVAYTDPTNSKNAYHLYIPVIVKKVMEFKFWASAKDGTDYYTGAYDGLEYPAIGSHGNQVTTLITYAYQRTQPEWQAAIDNGENLMWNFPKILMLNDGNGTNLPVGTKLTLVDRNNLNQVYYYTTDGLLEQVSGTNKLKLPLSLFGLEEVPLCSLLDLTVESDSSGSYIETSKDDATIQAKGTYYRLATDEEKTTKQNELCKITVSGTAKQEQYYLTIQTPGDASVFVNLLVECEDRLTNPTGKVGLPTTRLPAKDDPSGQVQYARKGAENRIVIGNFFTQTVTVTTDGQDLMSDTNLTVTGTLTAKIQFAGVNALDNFVKYGNSRSLYQQFSLYLKKSVNSIETVVPYAEGTVLTVGNKSYPIGGETYHKLDIKQVSISTDGANPTASVEIPFTLSYTLSGIEAQFPEKNLPTDGILVYAESSLSYDSQMQQSGLKGTGQGDKRYFREEVHLATLTYNAYENAYGTQRYGWSQLGINDLDSNGDYQILSAALYDVHELTNASSADTLKISVKLLQKTDGGGYVDVSKPLSSYLSSITVSPKVNPTGSFLTAQSVLGGTAEFSLEGTDFNSSVPIEIDVDMNVITGAAFENAGLTYANYKLVLKAELLQGGKTIEGSPAEDYIIYTNAKIIPTLVS